MAFLADGTPGLTPTDRGVPRRTAVAGAGALAFALTLALAACSSERAAPEPREVVARVNGYEITMDEVNRELDLLKGQSPYAGGGAPRRVLERLVDRELLAQEAAEAGLDRVPQVAQALDRVRRQVLMEAYLEHKLEAPRPGPEEVRRFYEEHPALFGQRRVYSFRDYLIDASRYTSALRIHLGVARTRAAVLAALQSANMDFRETVTVRSAEQLPLDMLPGVAAMARGETAALHNEGKVILMQLVDYTEQPVALEQARPFIEQYLVNSKRRQLTERRLEELRGMARIAYPVPLNDRRDGIAPDAGHRHEVQGPAAPDPGTEVAANEHKLPGRKRE